MARTAKDVVEYKVAWSTHINELATLALAANVPYNEYIALKAQLHDWLASAIGREFTNEGVSHE